MAETTAPPFPHIAKLPRLVTERWYNTLSRRLLTAEQANRDVLLDATEVKWMSPFGTVLIADFASKQLAVGHKVKIQMPTRTTEATYIRESDLLRLIESSDIASAIRPDNLQLRRLTQMQGDVPEFVANFASDQASNVNEKERSLLRMWITELLANASDHAQSERGFWICARYNPRQRDIRICVADSGIGIRTSLVNSGKYGSDMTHAQAVELALREGVTARLGVTGGLGLKRIAAYVKSCGGALTIISGDARISVRRKKRTITATCPLYQGTVVNATFDTRALARLESGEGSDAPFHFE